jgi:cell division protein DivIC
MKKVLPYLKNKYVITLTAFIIWVAFFDRNDLIVQYTYRQKLHQLQQDKRYYIEEVQKSKTDMQELMTNPRNLEKFAREKYLMKKDNEDVFVFVKEDSTGTPK